MTRAPKSPPHRRAAEEPRSVLEFRFSPGTLLLYLLLIALALVTLFPFYWVFVLATHAQGDIYSAPPPFWFGDNLAQNYATLTGRLPFLRNIWNSFYIAGLATLFTVITSSMAGYAFALYQFRFKRALFSIIVTSLMLPPLIGIIPYYLIIQTLGWMNTPRALWVPGMVSAFGIFLMRQYIASAVPKDLLDAGRIDGASELRLYWSLVLPIVRPGLATLGLLTFIGQWNSFLTPLLVLNQNHTFTVPVALRTMQGLIQVDWGAVLLGSALAVLPLLVLFAVASRQVIEGLVAGSVKG
ncbi:MAG: carbohydrate ABC transporter permease [Trueperaceae bacterium]|nr:carbohydrate ABC transporter permease [Trueperaceae bacterium]